MVAFPSTPTVGQQYLQWIWDGAKWVPASQSVPQCGVLQLVGATPSTQLAFSPFNGNLIKLNGVIRRIPSASITATASSCYINGALGALVANTLYYVYVWDNAGTLALDFSETAWAISTTSGNIGTAIKTGDDTRTLVGLVYTSTGTVQFVDSNSQRMTRSWFNRSSASMMLGLVDQGSFGSTGSGNWNGTNIITSWVQFAGESWSLLGSTLCSETSGNLATMSLQWLVDGAQTAVMTTTVWGAGWQSITMSPFVTAGGKGSQGLHTSQLILSQNGGIIHLYGGMTGQVG